MAVSNTPRHLDRLDNPDPDWFVQEYVVKQRPAVITGVASSWSAMRWSPDYFRTAFAGAAIRYETWDGDESINDPLEFQDKQVFVESTMAEFVDLMRQGSRPSRKHYCAQFRIFDVLPQLRRDFPPMERYMGFSRLYPARLQKLLQIAPFLWLGPAGVISTLHFDRSHNFFVQIHGRKKWIHIPPEQSDHLYFPCAGFNAGLFHFSPVDPEHPDLERWPLYARAEPIETIVEPGELVFTPAGWWHHVRALDTSISMNFFWQLPLDNALALRRYLLLLARRKVLSTLGLDALIESFEAVGRRR